LHKNKTNEKEKRKRKKERKKEKKRPYWARFACHCPNTHE
jgi:hypothetical protein